MKKIYKSIKLSALPVARLAISSVAADVYMRQVYVMAVRGIDCRANLRYASVR